MPSSLSCWKLSIWRRSGVILDNLNTHKPKDDCWLARHKNVHFHFTPTHAFWLNQVEVWFSIFSAKALAGASFTSPRQVHDQIDAFINAYNQNRSPLRVDQASRILAASTS